MPDAERSAERIGVVPAATLKRGARLFAALEQAFEVRFEGREAGHWRDLDGVVAVTGPGSPTVAIPPGMPAVLAGAEEGPAGSVTAIELSRAPALDRRLRGQRLHDRLAEAAAPVPAEDAAAVLARRGADVLWAVAGTGGSQHRVALLPAELQPGETLRERLTAGRFLALAPLISLLRSITAHRAWEPPPLRAALMFDDPNLHWPSYGFIDFAALARHAREHRYHVAFAMVPRDAWFAHPRAARLFRSHPETLSLLMHGNDHLYCELGRERSDDANLSLLAQALRRSRAFERRTGIAVAPVMTPPHGRCSEPMLRAMLRTDLEAACISRPYPWLERPPDDAVLAQWRVADLVAGGLPVLPRYPLSRPREDLVWRAFLDQPLVLYGHHGDVSHGLDPLAEAAGQINALGAVLWLDMATIARTNMHTRRRGEDLYVRLSAHRTQVQLPAGVSRIIAWPEGGELTAGTRVAVRGGLFPHGRHVGQPGEPVAVPVGEGGTVELSLIAPDSVIDEQVPRPPLQPWVAARRLLVEARDRARPLFSR